MKLSIVMLPKGIQEQFSFFFDINMVTNKEKILTSQFSPSVWSVLLPFFPCFVQVQSLWAPCLLSILPASISHCCNVLYISDINFNFPNLTTSDLIVLVKPCFCGEHRVFLHSGVEIYPCLVAGSFIGSTCVFALFAGFPGKDEYQLCILFWKHLPLDYPAVKWAEACSSEYLFELNGSRTLKPYVYLLILEPIDLVDLSLMP